MTCDRARRDQLYWAFTGEERFYDDDDDEDTGVESVVVNAQEGVQGLVEDKTEGWCLFFFLSIAPVW